MSNLNYSARDLSRMTGEELLRILLKRQADPKIGYANIELPELIDMISSQTAAKLKKEFRLEPKSPNDELNRKEAAAYLGVHPTTIDRFAREGSVAASGRTVFLGRIRKGNRNYYRRADLDQFRVEIK